MKTITVADFAKSFGTHEDTFSTSCRQLIVECDFRYRDIEGDELNTLILSVLKRIDEDRQVIASQERQAVWEKGWQENLDEFIASEFDENKLVPKFIRSNVPIRYMQKYIFPEHAEFELSYVKVFRQWYLENFFSDVDNIYEFGCGTGFNLLAAAGLFPQKHFFGSDFVQSSVDLVNAIGESKAIPLSAEIFDMMQPNQEC